jgi:hypothetical protein
MQLEGDPVLMQQDMRTRGVPVKCHTFLSSVAALLFSNIFPGYVIRWLSGPVCTWQCVESPEPNTSRVPPDAFRGPGCSMSSNFRTEILTVDFSGTEF